MGQWGDAWVIYRPAGCYMVDIWASWGNVWVSEWCLGNYGPVWCCMGQLFDVWASGVMH